MSSFRGKRIPDYNPFWEEKEHQEGKEEHWFWYHLGHDDGYQYADLWLLSEGKSRQELVNEVESLRALIDANKRVSNDYDEWLKKELDVKPVN